MTSSDRWLRHATEPSDAKVSSQERICFQPRRGSKFAIEGVPSFARVNLSASYGWQAQRAHAPDRQRMSTDWPIKIRFDPHGRMLAQPAVMSKRFVYVLRNHVEPATVLRRRHLRGGATPRGAQRWQLYPYCQVPSVVS